MLMSRDNRFKDGKTESVQLAQYDSFQTDKFYIRSTSLCSWKLAPVSSGPFLRLAAEWGTKFPEPFLTAPKVRPHFQGF